MARKEIMQIAPKSDLVIPADISATYSSKLERYLDQRVRKLKDYCRSFSVRTKGHEGGRWITVIKTSTVH